MTVELEVQSALRRLCHKIQIQSDRVAKTPTANFETVLKRKSIPGRLHSRFVGSSLDTISPGNSTALSFLAS